MQVTFKINVSLAFILFNLLFLLYSSKLLYAEVTVSNSTALSYNDSTINTIRADNRLIANYTNSAKIKGEIHLLTSVSNERKSLLKIPTNLIVKDDSTNLFRLYNDFTFADNGILINKIDRAYLSLFDQNYELTFGRTTLTWSRGRIFHVTDFFNPQTPGFYDADYKVGTDLLYYNFSLNNNNNFSFVINPKRDLIEKNLTVEDSTFAIKYLYSSSKNDLSIITAQYLADYMLGGGFSSDFIASSVIRSDIAIWLPEYDRNMKKTMLMLAVEKSDYIFDIPSTYFIEYFHNKFGSEPNKPINPSMLKRLKNNDIYIIGQHYLALGIINEITPYTTFNYSNIISLHDFSSFNMLGLNYAWNQQFDLSLSLFIPIGRKGEEFGTICNNGLKSCYKQKGQIIIAVKYFFDKIR